MHDKAAVRRHLRQARRRLSAVERFDASEKAVDVLARSGLLEAARVIALYAPLVDEADPTGLEGRLADRIIAYPRTTIVEGDPCLVFGASRLADLEPRGPWAIREPEPSLTPIEPDVVVVPGLGFTADGARIGYGGGYYDRTLARLRAQRGSVVAIGLGFHIQLVPELPVDEHDQAMDAVLTERGLVAAPQAG